MHRTLSLLTALTFAACNSSKAADRPPEPGKPAEAPAPATAPTEEEVIHFLEAWLPAVARLDVDATQAMLPDAVVEIAGCTGDSCLRRIHEIAGVAQAVALGDAKVEPAGDRARVVLRFEDVLIGSLELELQHLDGRMRVARVRAEWRDGWIAAPDAEAVAFVKTWLATFRKKPAAADAGLGAAFVHVRPDCGDGPLKESHSKPCIAGRLHEIVGPGEELVVAAADRATIDVYSDDTGKLRALERVTFVEVDTTVSPGDMEYAEMLFAIAMDRHGALVIKGLEVESAYGNPDIDH